MKWIYKIASPTAKTYIGKENLSFPSPTILISLV
jgi:hypothetical protein